MTRIAIVGGGFSGTIVLANLVEHVAPETTIDIFDSSGVFGPGLAYSTGQGCHLLNVTAARMGAFAPDHFAAWLSTPGGEAAITRLCPGFKPQRDDFAPRALYGAYLKDILAATLKKAASRGVHVTLRHATVVDASKQKDASTIYVLVNLGGKSQYHSYDAMVLATGNRPPHGGKLSQRVQASRSWFGNPWTFANEDRLVRKVKALSSQRTVLILGTGLTAVDAILSLKQLGFGGRIIAISRRGLLPAPHADGPGEATPWAWRVTPDLVPSTAIDTLRWLKHEVRAAGTAWRSVFLALRPVTQQLWRRLPPGEQKKLLRYHTLWSVNRHRMAPAVAAQIRDLIGAGQLEVIAGRVILLARGLLGLRAVFCRRGSTHHERLRPSLILNCMGPDYNVAGDNFLSRLTGTGIVQSEPNGLGLVLESDGDVESTAPGRIIAIGTPLFGSLFETTAVPELREQARQLADRLAQLSYQSVIQRDRSYTQIE